jgi:hypothetical protein
MAENRGVAVGVSVMIVAFLTIFGSLLVVLGWIGLSIYALVKAIGSAPDAPNPTVVVLLFLGLVGTFTVLLAAGVALAGRAMTPRRRKKGEREEQLALDVER